MSTDWERYNPHSKNTRKSKRQDNVSVSTLKVNGRFIIDDCQKANALNDQFCSVFFLHQMTLPLQSTPQKLRKQCLTLLFLLKEFRHFFLESNRQKHQMLMISHHVSFRNYQKKSLQHSNLYSAHPLTVRNNPKIGYMHVCHKYTKVAIRTEAPQKVTALYHSLAFAAKRLSTLCIAIL